jgi:predicted phosphodiesterase
MPGFSAIIKGLIRSFGTRMAFITLLLLFTPLYSQQSSRIRTSPEGGPGQRHAFPARTLGPRRAPGPESPENRPFKTYDTHPVLLYGPFILDISDKSATIEWITDTPCVAKVKYGENALDRESEPAENGLIPVGTLHRIELAGLNPGHTYQYQTVSSRVVRLKPYWPDMGLSTESPTYTFTTLDPMKSSASFSVITDTHEDVSRIDALMKIIDWKATDFLVFDGDAVNWAENQDQVLNNFLEPVSEGLYHVKSLIYVRGNHDLRGSFARSLDKYLTTPDINRFYFSRDDGPVHLIVIDTGEDKPDNTNVYSHLNETAPYRQEELKWFKHHVKTDARIRTAPFRIVLMHQPYWGWVDGKNKEWTGVANSGRVDLAIAGHWHRFAFFERGTEGNDFPVLVLGQNQVARVDATEADIHVTVTDTGGAVIDTFIVKRRAR